MGGGGCACGRVHESKVQSVRICEASCEEDLLSLLEGLQLEGDVLCVADEYTWEVQGKEVYQELRGHLGRSVRSFVFPGRKRLHPDEHAVGALTISAHSGVGMIVAVGSGTVNDICRFVSFVLGIPYVVVATAPSMDGYASSVSPLLVNGKKQTFPAHVPFAVFASRRVLQEAPSELIRAGVGDMIGKRTALTDWRLSHRKKGEYYCPEVASLMEQAVDAALDSLRSGDGATGVDVTALMEGLVLSGLAMEYVGSSRPASGSEHHLVHYWEYRLLDVGVEPPFSHGSAVGVATLCIAHCYAFMSARLPDLVSDLGLVPPSPSEVHALLVSSGLKIRPAQLGIDGNLLHDSIRHASELRPHRYTILQMAREMDLIDDMADYVVSHLRG